MSFPPSLLIESIEVDGDHVTAELQLGPRRRTLVIDLSMMDMIIGFVKMPRELDCLIRPQRAIFDVMIQAYRGEAVRLPLDLSASVVTDELQYWPLFYQGAEAHEADPPVAIEIVRVERDCPEPGVATVYLDVVGVTTVVMVGQNERGMMQFRFVSGVHPWQLGDVEAWAMRMALARATSKTSPSTS